MNATETEAPDVFSNNPRAQLHLVEMGHAYGTARYGGTCPLTGARIIAGSTRVRHLVFRTREGRVFDGYVPAKTAELLNFCGATFATSWSPWRRWTPGWLDGLDLGALPNGTTIRVMTDAKGSMEPTILWWRKFGAKWRSSANGDSTDGQLLATFRRRTSASFFDIELPR